MAIRGTKLRDEAAKCRRLAKELEDAIARAALIEIAVDLDLRADRADLSNVVRLRVR